MGIYALNSALNILDGFWAPGWGGGGVCRGGTRARHLELELEPGTCTGIVVSIKCNLSRVPTYPGKQHAGVPIPVRMNNLETLHADCNWHTHKIMTKCRCYKPFDHAIHMEAKEFWHMIHTTRQYNHNRGAITNQGESVGPPYSGHTSTIAWCHQVGTTYVRSGCIYCWIY
jgi:hypothetical protein